MQQQCTKEVFTSSVTEEAQRLHSEGNNLVQEKAYIEAVEKYTAAIALQPTPARYNNRAHCYLLLGELNKCLEDCKKVLCAEPCNVKALYRFGSAHERLGHFLTAKEFYSQILLSDSNHSEAAEGLQRVKAKWRKIEGSIQDPGLPNNQCYHIDKWHKQNLNDLLRYIQPLFVVGHIHTADQGCKEIATSCPIEEYTMLSDVLMTIAVDAVLNQDFGNARLFATISIYLQFAHMGNQIYGDNYFVSTHNGGACAKFGTNDMVSTFYRLTDQLTATGDSLMLFLRQRVKCTCLRPWVR